MDIRSIAYSLAQKGRSRIEKISSGYLSHCPCHHSKDGLNLSLSLGRNGSLLVYCFAGCSSLEVLKHCETPERLSTNRRNFQSKVCDTSSASQTNHNLLASMSHKFNIAKLEDSSKQYLASRGIDIEQFEYSSLRTIEGAMVGRVQDALGNTLGYHRTFLPFKKRKFLGNVRGGYIAFNLKSPLMPEYVAVAEGIETALSFGLLYRPAAVLCALSASFLPYVDFTTVRKILIAADRDEAGIKAAQTLARKLHGYNVRILSPSNGKDYNDILSCVI